MGSIFKLDSPFMRFLTLVTNIICLNVLWLVCCLPIVTAGAATTAMYYVIFQYITGQDDAVVKPFFRAFKDNFGTATPIWILNMLIGFALFAEALYLSQNADIWLIILFCIITFFYIGASSYLYPLLARYDVPVRKAVINSFAFSMRHLLSTVLLVGLNVLPVALYFILPELFLHIGILWVLGGFALIAYVNGRLLYMIFKKYDQDTE